MPKKIKKDDRLLIFFSGHGETTKTRDGKDYGYLVPVNGDIEALYSTCISMRELTDWSDLIPAKQMLFIIDACYSGIAGITKKSSKLDKDTRNQVEIFIQGGGRQIMTAGTSKEQVAMSKKWEDHSAYTYFLLRGLRGEADYNKDKVISIRELQVYLDDKVPKEVKQHPQLYYLGPGEGQFIFYKKGDIK